MCFPSKKQKDNFNDTDKADKKSTTRNGSGTDGKGTKGEQTAVASSSEPPSATPAPPTLPPVVTTDNSIVMSPPKVAIIIYSMYGHIAKCTSLVGLSTSNADLAPNNLFSSGRGGEGRHRESRGKSRYLSVSTSFRAMLDRCDVSCLPLSNLFTLQGTRNPPARDPRQDARPS